MHLLKFFHLLFVFLWIGSLITLSGLMALQKKESKELTRLFKKGYLSVDLPAMLLTIVFGTLLLFFKPNMNWKAPWLHMKLTFAALLIICDLIHGRSILRLQKEGARVGGLGRLILHGTILLLLALILVAIYILK